MGVHRMQKSIPGNTIRACTRSSQWIQRGGITSRVVGSAVATDDVGPGVPQIRVVNPELSMVKDVESFHTELKNAAFCHLEVLQKAHVKVQTVWVIQKIATGVAERQSPGSDKHIRVSEQRTKTLLVKSFIGSRSGIGCQVRVGARTHTICY